jgi:hypothetical protein
VMGSTKREGTGTGTTLLALVVDRSGSMSDIKEDLEGGIETLIEQQAKEEGICLVTLAQFDDVYEVLTGGIGVDAGSSLS